MRPAFRAMKRTLVVITLVALVVAVLLAASKLTTSRAAQAGRHCASVVKTTDADGRGTRKQYREPELVYINGEAFPANTVLSFTVTHRDRETDDVVASGSVSSDQDGAFTAVFVWDGTNAFQGGEGYRIMVTPAEGCAATNNFQYRAKGPVPVTVPICHATGDEDSPYVELTPTIEENGTLADGHLDHAGSVFPHANWGDIVPPYVYVDQAGQLQTYPGLNLETAAGQETYTSAPRCQAALPPPPPDPEPVTPLVECVELLSGGGFLAHYGYENPNDEALFVDLGSENMFSPGSPNRGQPTTLDRGRVNDALQAESAQGSPLTWSLNGTSATASLDSRQCEGSITINKLVDPSGDHGRFNLEIDGEPVGDSGPVGDGGTSGTIAVGAGPHTVGESGAGGTDLALFDTEIVCHTGGGAGPVVAEGAATSVAVTVARGEALVCTITNTHKERAGPDPPLPLAPVLECVVLRTGGPDTAVWGYQNPNHFAVHVPVGGDNELGGLASGQNPPTTFEPGRMVGEFQTPFEADVGSLSWTLTGTTATAAGGSRRCTATLELRMVVEPADDPGIFNLLIDGEPFATGGNGTTTGAVVVGVGEATASETAGAGTLLSNYESRIDCTRNGQPVPSVEGTRVDEADANGDVVVCTFTNRRITAPTEPPPPEPPPPAEPPSPSPPPPGPPPERLDLIVTASAEPTTVRVGETITWTMTVANGSSVDAADVNGVKLADPRSFRTQLISLTTSQGACTIQGCALGRLVPGASATITAVTRATQVGEVLNIVRIGSEEIESDYVNNTASALVRVIGELPPPVVDRCGFLTSSPRVLVARRSSAARAVARNLLGEPVAGILVRARGAGTSARARTNAKGVARFSLTPRRAGVVRFRGSGARATATLPGPRCRTLVGVLPAKQQKRR
jgi:uncharacterized repeat protein (TIGR01451 family)